MYYYYSPSKKIDAQSRVINDVHRFLLKLKLANRIQYTPQIFQKLAYVHNYLL